MLLALSASCPAAAVRAVSTPRGGHQQPAASSQRAAVYDVADIEVTAPQTLTRRARRRRRRRAEEARPMNDGAEDGMTSTAIVHGGAEDSPLQQFANARALWEMIEPDTQHLAEEDCTHLRASIDVLLAKVETATSVIAEPISARAPPLLLGPDGLRELASYRGQDLDPRAELARGQALLAVLEGLNSAMSLLKLRCDAPTAAAAMLSEAAITEASPTWPVSTSSSWPATMPYFSACVDELLTEARRLKRLPRAARELDEGTAEAVRFAMLRDASDARALLVLLACARPAA